MKKRTHAGFTLAETLITVALLGIIFTAVSGGLVAFEKAYNKITRKANAQIMLNTAILEISNDLKGATIYYSAETQYLTFYTTAREYAIQYVRDPLNTDVGLLAKPYPDSTTLQSIPLLTSKTNTDNLIVDITAFSYTKDTNDDAGVFTVTVAVMPSDTTGVRIEEQTIQVKTNNSVEVK